jgi:hypothetical protein
MTTNLHEFNEGNILPQDELKDDEDKVDEVAGILVRELH